MGSEMCIRDRSCYADVDVQPCGCDDCDCDHENEYENVKEQVKIG